MESPSGQLNNESTAFPEMNRNGYINDKLGFFIHAHVLVIYIHMTVRAFGIGSNLINILVFTRSGCKDGITVSLLVLSVADFLYVFINFVSRMFTALRIMSGVHSYISLSFFSFVFAWNGNVHIDNSVAITVFIALQKCACVAIPLLFQNVFTRTRCTVVVLSLYGLMFLSYLPLNVLHGLKPRFNPLTNSTQLVYKASPYYAYVYSLYKTFNRTALPVTSLIIVILCLIILTLKLRQSARFRQTASSVQTNSAQAQSVSSKAGVATDAKEIRVIKTVTLVSTIFVCCYIPFIVSSIFEFIFPEFSTTGQYKNTFWITHELHNIMITVNSSINIFVYYRFNKKYRKEFLVLFKRMLCKCYKGKDIRDT